MFSHLKHPKTLHTINCDHKSNTHKRNCIFNWKKEEPTHTIIVTGRDASYQLTCCHNLCSYQIIVPVEITDMNGERYLKMYVLTKSCLLR